MDARDEIAKVAAECGWVRADSYPWYEGDDQNTVRVIDCYHHPRHPAMLRLRFRWFVIAHEPDRQGFGVDRRSGVVSLQATSIRLGRLSMEFAGKNKRGQVVEYLRGINAPPSG